MVFASTVKYENLYMCDLCLKIYGNERSCVVVDLEIIGLNLQPDLCRNCRISYLENTKYVANKFKNRIHRFRIKAKVLELEEKGYRPVKHNRLI